MATLFIVRYPEPPVQVPQSGRVTIGRAQNNSIVLAEPRVSRLHAIIEWREKERRYVIYDIGSANGTVLNNEKLFSNNDYPLKDWDKIRIVSAVFTVRFVDRADDLHHEFRQMAEKIHTEATRFYSRMEIRHPEAVTALTGTLEHLCPIDLFQMLETGRKSGKLWLTSGRGEGTFTIRDGMIMSAQFGAAQGEQALFDILDLNKGMFAFTPMPESEVPGNMNRPITALLMEGCRLMDERNAGKGTTG